MPKESKEAEPSEDEVPVTEADTATAESSVSTYSGAIPESSPKNIAGKVVDVSYQPEIQETIRSFLKRARAAYGRTALCLSGGGMMANCHYGVIKALLEEDCLPHIISGTSAGSVVGSLVCTRTDEELMRDLDPEILTPRQGCFTRSWMERAKSVYHTGHMFDGEEWYHMILWFTCGEMTFEEAYKKTGRVLCISLSATTKKAPPVLLNYITAPNVVIASAIIASAAVPGFITPVRLRVKNSMGVVKAPMMDKGETYWDGSIQQDIPTSGLAEMLNW
jgi:predicted acylesterase/phospholipase RssA